jgi:hypothetical protein
MMYGKIAIKLLGALLVVAGALVKFDPPVQAAGKQDTAATLLAMERAALDRWGKGDPDGFLEISDPDVVYFDPAIPERMNGLEALREYYEPARGKIKLIKYDIINPKVEISDDGSMAVLTFNFVSHSNLGEMRWNTTEVYRRRNNQWRIIQTHWSLTQPKLQKTSGN